MSERELGMDKTHVLLGLFFLGFLVSLTVAEGGARPGFLYTRSKGKCTPEYWSSRRETWPKMVPLTSSVSKVFGSRALDRYRADLTLLEATERNDDIGNAYHRLLKQASAALLNSYARKPFPYSSWKVKTLLIQALVSEKAADLQASQFSSANQNCS
ncbi:uncharacterized protein LOC18447116 [Amborella trichopoda]|uniref:Uncharacterized protein n=1 Tax=Amborella trichopoda TaxID=13333 RepID=U5D8E8_AMBTC|nr:uncharacterized protein LOC18447116 [Amborella trichopoda]ERN18749.1 hypothetical protein AMTR_s00067p00030870 [Amborella trichopoda]|eukprot:XP_006857282.1 uncharacterized protein LOC18447116 [Amborella trichopoda]